MPLVVGSFLNLHQANMRFLFQFLALMTMTSFSTSQAATWLRINQAGYAPERVKKAVVLSDTDIAGESWNIKKGDKTVLSGKIPAGKKGQDFYVAQEYYYTIDFSSLKEKGEYALEFAGAQTQRIIISEDPYSLFATQALMHLRAMRSSHLKDNAAPVHVVDGDWQQGKWKEASPRRTVDMQGGHYDAGDYIKFTLNEAYLAWHLLTAYRENPSLFVKAQSPSNLPDILDEAKYSLDYLAKTFPDENTFVIQVGDSKDHDQGWRLPKMDALDGKRPALCALSRAHMGSTAAALALGAQVFKTLDANSAALYESKAKAIYARARQSDTQASAFERSVTNDFYYDPTDVDNMALAASYLGEAKAYAPPPAYEVSWSDWNAFANHNLALLGDAAAKKRLLQEVARYDRSDEIDNVWKVTGGYTWGSLHRWIGMANAHERASRLDGKSLTAPFLGVLDYVFGRNNWGIAMLASADLPYSVRNIYNGIYRLTKAFPVGALSEGPGDREMHIKMKEWLPVPENSPFEEFNTSAGVFYDNADDFMVQESTVGGQGDLLLMLALASAKNLKPKADLGTIPASLPPDREIPALASNQKASRGPASLFVNRVGNMFYFTPAQFCKADSLTILDVHGKHFTTLHKNGHNQFVWNTSRAASGIYQIHPSDGSPFLTVKK